MAKRDYYDVLEVPKGATESEIKKAYRKMALKFHPDKNPGDKAAEEKFKEAAEAYEILGNPEKKVKYDQYGHAGVGGGSARGGGGHYGGGMSMEDIFSQFGDIFGSGGFGGFQQRGGGGGRRMHKGSNIRIKVKLTLEEIANGVEKKVKVNKHVACGTCTGSGAAKDSGHSNCSTCRGTGQVTRVTNTILGQMQTTATCPQCEGEGRVIAHKCRDCSGTGVVNGEEVITIKIPAGVGNDMQLSVGGKGNAGPRNGYPGDLIVVIEEIEHEFLKRDGIHLHYDLYVSFIDAALGTSVEVPIVDGKAKIKLEPGTQAGKILRLREKGLPEVNGYGRGDLLVNINVWTPQRLSAEERTILEKLKASPNFKPEPEKGDKGFFQKMKDYFH